MLSDLSICRALIARKTPIILAEGGQTLLNPCIRCDVYSQSRHSSRQQGSMRGVFSVSKRGENIYKRKDGRWEGRYIKERSADGKARYAYVYGKSYADAKQKLLDRRIAQAQNIDCSPSHTKYGDILRNWIAMSRVHIKESTYSRYVHLANVHILPYLGELPTDKLTTQTVEKHISFLLNKGRVDKKGGLAPKTVSDILTLIKGSIDYANCSGYSVNCYLDRLTVKKTQLDMRVLSIDEQHRLCDILMRDMNLTKFGVLLCMYTGIRIGEVCALKWESIDFSEGILSIRETLQRIQATDVGACKKTKIVITEPKSKKAIRDIPLPGFVLEYAASLKHNPKAYRAQKEWLVHYTETLSKLVLLERPDVSVETETKLVVKFLADLFPHFGHRVGMTYEVYDMAQFNRNNQIAHPDRFDRYFQLDMDSIAYKTVDVRNVIYNLDEGEIIDFLLKQEENGTSYELLEDIRARITELSGNRAKIIISALFKSMKSLNKTVRKSWLSMSTGVYAEHMMLDLIERIPTKERVPFISTLISCSDMDALQSIATVINMLELGYGRLAAEGQERNYKKVITLDELITVETMFVDRVKEVLKTSSLFDFSEWRMVYHLLDSFDPEYTKSYLDSALIQDENVLWFLGHFVNVWTGTGKEYEIQKGYTDYFSTERVLNAIESCRKNGTFFRFPEELQHKCAAFSLAHSGSPDYSGGAYQDDTEKLIASWKS